MPTARNATSPSSPRGRTRRTTHCRTILGGPRSFTAATATSRFPRRSCWRLILHDSSIQRVYLMIDADKLLGYITEEGSDLTSKAKWLAASHNSPDIEEQLRPDDFA